jgi:hypothetical protein
MDTGHDDATMPRLEKSPFIPGVKTE